MSGSLSFNETTQLVRESVFVVKGSSAVSIEMLAPGSTSFTELEPLCNETIFVLRV